MKWPPVLLSVHSFLCHINHFDTNLTIWLCSKQHTMPAVDPKSHPKAVCSAQDVNHINILNYSMIEKPDCGNWKQIPSKRDLLGSG